MEDLYNFEKRKKIIFSYLNGIKQINSDELHEEFLTQYEVQVPEYFYYYKELHEDYLYQGKYPLLAISKQFENTFVGFFGLSNLKLIPLWLSEKYGIEVASFRNYSLDTNLFRS